MLVFSSSRTLSFVSLKKNMMVLRKLYCKRQSNGVLYTRLSYNDKYTEQRKSLEQNAVNILSHTASQIVVHSKEHREPNCQEAATRCHRKSKIISAARVKLCYMTVMIICQIMIDIHLKLSCERYEQK